MRDGARRLSPGEWISGVSAILLFVFMFFKWYDLELVGTGGLLGNLSLFKADTGGNAWQTLDLLPLFLLLVITVTVAPVLLRLGRMEWEPAVRQGVAVCVLGGLATLWILARIVFPPDFESGIDNYVYESTLKAGIFFALVAACGIAYGGYRVMREEGVPSAGLSTPRSRRG